MPKAEKKILAEFRYSDAEERMMIEALLKEAKATITGRYHGLLEARLPVTALEQLKEHNVLMDFIPETTGAEAEIGDKVYIKKAVEPTRTKDEVATEDSGWIDRVKRLTVRVLTDNFVARKLRTSGSVKERLKDSALYILMFKKPLNKEIRQTIKEEGIQLYVYVQESSEPAYRVFLTPAQHLFLKNWDAVRSLTKYHSARKAVTDVSSISRQLDTMLAADQKDMTVGAEEQYDIKLKDACFNEEIIPLLHAVDGLRIVDHGLHIIRVSLQPGITMPDNISKSDRVHSIVPYEPPELFCDVSRVTLGLKFTSPATAFYGEGEIVAVIDSGIDARHPDLKDRIREVLQYGAGTAEDAVGHGTHVAGIICGDGAASKGEIQGIAPKAGLISIGVVGPDKKLDLPVDIGKVLKMAVDKGARIINLSWGYKLKGEYHYNALSVDKFIYENPEVLVVTAAGNEGKTVPRTEQIIEDGKPVKKTLARLEYHTISVPGCAKNVLTVGAATSRRAEPLITETWGQRSQASFPNPPQKDIPVVSAQDAVALVSSSGPTSFDSIKPEVLAPGTYILAARAAHTEGDKNTPDAYSQHYTFKTGTSMAAPVVSGIAAVLREYLRKEHACDKPSSSLLKALIISTCRRLDNPRKPPEDTSLAQVGFPDFDQGYGLIDLHALLNDRSVQLLFADVPNNSPLALESRVPEGGKAKSYREYTFTVTDATADLVVTLAWLDPPGRGVQNNLQLSVKTPSNEWELGNMEHVYRKSDIFDGVNDYNLKPHDKYNNCERVVIPQPEPGAYRIRISAQNTVTPQGYSLAILGKVADLAER